MKKFILILATGFGVGYLSWMPGTFGSGVGLLACFFFQNLPPLLFGVTLVALIFLSSWVSTKAEILLDEKDSQKIVIDEVVGMLVTLSFIPFSLKTALLGFILFRLFDIWKPYPVRWIQDRIPVGWGVVGDDVMAGIYAHLTLRLVLRLL